MKAKPFDLQVFLSKADGGRTITQYRNGQVIYNQADPADTVFYIRSGEGKVTVLSGQGKEAVVALHRKEDFFGEGCLNG